MAPVENVIVGAGPYGLSLAAHMRAAGTDFRIIGHPLESWRMNMPSGMMLKSEPFASNLSDPDRRFRLKDFCAAESLRYHPKHVPLQLSNFIRYADWFQRFAVPEVTRAKVVSLCRIANRFAISLDDGETFSARRAILAIGHLAFRSTPPVLAKFPDTLVSHSSDHRGFEAFKGRDVTVVGCGQSALESAALLHETGASVRVLARAAAVDWNAHPINEVSILDRLLHPDAGLGRGRRSFIYSELPRMIYLLPQETRKRIVATVNGPTGSWWLKDRLVGKVSLLTSHQIEEAKLQGEKLQLKVRAPGGSVEISTDHVIAATGYKVDVDNLTFIEAGLLSDLRCFSGYPILSANYESSVPGLHFMGLASALSFGPVMRFIYGAKHAAKAINAHVRDVATRRAPKSAWIGQRPYEPTAGSGL